MKQKKSTQSRNYLDLIPAHNPAIHWHLDWRQRVVLEVENKGFFNKVAQELFCKPKTTKVHLDAQGSYLWPLIDGEKTVMELAALQKEHFGEAAEPLYPRIVKYFQILESYHFCELSGRTGDDTGISGNGSCCGESLSDS